MKQYEQIKTNKKVFKEADYGSDTPIDSVASTLNKIFSKTKLSSYSLGAAIGMALLDNVHDQHLKNVIEEIENVFKVHNSK